MLPSLISYLASVTFEDLNSFLLVISLKLLLKLSEASDRETLS